MRKLSISLAAIVGLAVAAWAGDVWKDKSYQQWDQKDIDKIMSESPWSKKILLDASWRKDQRSANLNMPTQGGHVGGAATQRATDPSLSEKAIFYVAWQSSKTFQEAVLRRQVLLGVLKEDEAETKLSQQQFDKYQVTVFGVDMTPFMDVSVDQFKQGSWLELKKSKQKIAVDKVEVNREGDKITAVIFDFPKKTASGEPTIPPGEKAALFTTRIGKWDVKGDFDFSKMVDKQGNPDL